MMTKDEWLAAYYPAAAEDCPKDEAVAHSIRKWEGVAWAVKNTFPVPIRVDASTCALCVRYQDDDDSCTQCPLAISLGNKCDSTEDNDPAPWFAYQNNKNPLPMLAALRAIEQ